MKNIILLIFLIAILLAGIRNKSSAIMRKSVNEDEVAVLATVKRLGALMIIEDTAEMSKILDHDFTLTHITGYVQPKAEWLDEVAKESMKYYSVRKVDHTVQVNGNEATVIWRNLVDARIWGSRHTWRLQQKLRLEKRNDNWIILSSVASTF